MRLATRAKRERWAAIAAARKLLEEAMNPAKERRVWESLQIHLEYHA